MFGIQKVQMSIYYLVTETIFGWIWKHTIISAGTNFNADDIRRIAWDMLDNYERPDRDDVRILVGIEIVQILRMIDIYTDGVNDSLGHDCWYIDGIYFVYDKDLSALELKLQKKCMF